MKKILVFGKNGQVGWELQRALGLHGTVVCLDRNDRGGNLENIETMISRIKEENPQFVFNAAAYTAVDAAENDYETARRVNGEAVKAMALACKELDAVLIHYSTDYVFNGSGDRPWHENDQIEPINSYGLSKAIAEESIKEIGGKAYIFRTSWVYGVHGKNFMKTMLRLGKQQDSIGVVADQIGTPTSAEFIADVSSWLAFNKTPLLTDVVHLVPSGEASWYTFACEIFNRAKCDDLIVKKVKPLRTAEYKTIAERPLNSRLDNSKLLSLMPKNSIYDWKIYAARVLDEILLK